MYNRSPMIVLRIIIFAISFAAFPVSADESGLKDSRDFTDQELKDLKEKYDVFIPTAHEVDFNEVRRLRLWFLQMEKEKKNSRSHFESILLIN